MDKLFSPVQEGHDSSNRIVFICKDANGVYVFKPSNGFRSKHYPAENDEAAQACFNRQVSCGQVHAFYDEGETPAPGEEYPVVVDEPVVDEPIVDEPIVDEPIVDEPIVDEPAVDAPVVDEPAVDEPVAKKKPAKKKKAAKKSAAKK